MAICKFKSRPTSGVNFVGLVPQQEEKSKEGHQIEPPGFHVVYLLYADDRRQIPLVNNKIEHDPEAVETAKEVISKLKLKKLIPVENCSVQTTLSMIGKVSLYLSRKKSGLLQKGGGRFCRVQTFFKNPLWAFFEVQISKGGGGSRKARVQTFSEKIFPLQMLTLESRKGWGAGV